MIRPFDRERLREEFRNAKPFPFVLIEEFLEPDFARKVAEECPSFDQAQELGFEFNFVNEERKVQIANSALFPEHVAQLNAALAAPAFLADLSYITGIPDLIADPDLAGGGMHVTGPRGRLDVHVDFNYVEQKGWHRRLNLLLYLNPEWAPEWGGAVEFWDTAVKHRHHRIEPKLNCCVIFETSEISFHGVEPVTCPEELQRKSFAAYFYTEAPPEGWDGRKHSTIFKARPDEQFRGWVLMPAEKLRRGLRARWNTAKRTVKKWIRRA